MASGSRVICYSISFLREYGENFSSVQADLFSEIICLSRELFLCRLFYIAVYHNVCPLPCLLFNINSVVLGECFLSLA